MEQRGNEIIEVSWNGVDLENTTHPKYLGETLDRTLSYKQHIQNTKMKVATRNISVPIKDFIHHYPRALFNDIPRVGAHFYDIPGSGRTFTTYPGRDAV